MNTILIIIAVIFVLPLVIALFIPKNYSVENEIIINRPKQEVFDYIKMIKNQDQYSKWVMRDPDMKRTFTGTDGTVGFIYAWNGNKQAGEGEQEITGVTEGELITAEIRFVRPFKAISHTYVVTEAMSEHSTKVIWGLTGKSNYPLNLMTAMMKGALAKDIGTSLVNLKNILENKR
ncbi:polyketide cyclase [Flavobacterium album]|uniref:Polyketide cyclase n=1 Tax=Flavobacterium album TaxID=2175091 RepID=A0A2S1QX98_9FLAO|nr:SRPBCC family protein [Flavobacterium album]AWH85026.1 polyketide cyclase [Flavobacterium album]